MCVCVCVCVMFVMENRGMTGVKFCAEQNVSCLACEIIVYLPPL